MIDDRNPIHAAERTSVGPVAAPRRNIELKASDPDPERSLAVVKGLGARDRGLLRQSDTYFRVKQGRLKLREEEPGGATLSSTTASTPTRRASRATGSFPSTTRRR